MRYKELILTKIEKVQNLFPTLKLSYARRDDKSYNDVMEKMKEILSDLLSLVNKES
jgi:hypothetical protein